MHSMLKFSLAVLLVSGVLARPRALDDGTIAQKSHLTAFIVTDEGVKVECWEVSNLLPKAQKPRGGRCGSIQSPLRTSLYNDDLQGVDLLTWPEPTPIWPPPRNALNTFSVGRKPSLHLVSDGLVLASVHTKSGKSARGTDDDDDDDDNGNYIFSAENGDNWFYFEDQTGLEDSQGRSQCANAAGDPPLSISSRSADGTTLVQFKYDGAPGHTVLHPGRCRFTGLVNVESKNVNLDLEIARDSRLRVQEF